MLSGPISAVQAPGGVGGVSGVHLLGTVAIVVGLVVFGLVVRWGGSQLKRYFGALAVESLQAVVMAAAGVGAAVALANLWGATGTLQFIVDALQIDQNEVISVVLSVAFVVAGLVTMRLVKRLVHLLAEGPGVISKHHEEIAHHVVQFAVLILVFFLVLAAWHVPPDSVILGASVVSVVLGFAARQTLGSVLAGFVVLFSRPFEPGDWIVVEEDEGIVQDVSVVQTELKTFDDEVVLIPNDVVTGTKVINRSRNGRLRVNLDVGVDYDADVRTAADLAEEAMEGLDPIMERPTPHVVLSEFGGSSVVLRCRFYIENPTARRFWNARTAVIEAVKAEFDEAGITIPFPQRTLSARGGELALAGPPAPDIDGQSGNEGVDDGATEGGVDETGEAAGESSDTE